MYRGHSVCVVVPAYNEAAHVGTVIETMPAFVDRIYVVDDCSTDDTWDVIQNYVLSESDDSGADSSTEAIDAAASIADGGTHAGPRVVPISHAENQGAGGAIRTGYRVAREDGVDLTITMDADGQMNPDHASLLLDPLVEGEAEYAKGNRLATRRDWVEMPPFRLLGNWLLTMLTRVASGYWRTTDPQNGYTAITHGALRAIDVEGIRADHDYTNDLLVRLNVASMRVADVSMPAVYRDEESSIDYVSFIPTTSLTLARGFGWRLRERYLRGGVHPVAICYGAGVFCAALGFVGLLASLVGSATWNWPAALVLLACGPLVAAAMALDAETNAGLEVAY